MKEKEKIMRCRKLCAIRIKPTARIMAKIESSFRHLADYRKTKSLLKKYLTADMFNLIKYRVTSFGSTLLEVIQIGVETIESQLGVYAPDGEAYNVFSELFDPIIEEYHLFDGNHPATEFGFLHKIINVDLENKYVLSVRISCNRSLCGYPFHPRLTEDQYKAIEMRVSEDLKRLEGELKGEYFSLVKMDETMQEQLVQQNYLNYNQHDTFLKSAMGCKFWPIGRGVFYNKEKTFLVWINAEDHLQIISANDGGNLGACYKRFVKGVCKLGKLVAYLRDDRLGYLNFCPTYLGTGIEISIQIKLYKLPKNKQIFDQIAERYNLIIEAACGDKCTSFICTITYKPKMGINEFQAVKWMQNAIMHIIQTEYHI